jgi:hypothetical protein
MADGDISSKGEAASLAGERLPDFYRGWTIEPPHWPKPWTATGPNYDAWTGDEEGGGWSDNGHKADAPTREALIEEIDIRIEELGL